MKSFSLLVVGAVTLGLTFSTPASAVAEQLTVAISTKKPIRHKPQMRVSAPENDPHFIGRLTGSCKAQQDAGICVIDLGYGRCESCNVGGPR